MARNGQVSTRRKIAADDRGIVIVKACQAALEQLESRQMLSVSVAPSAAAAAAARHAAHIHHVRHLRHMAVVSRSIAAPSSVSVSGSSSAPVVAADPVAASPPPAFTTIQAGTDAASNQYLEFEAEHGYITDPDNDGLTWKVRTGTAADGISTTASGGAALFANRPVANNGFVTYHVHFNAPGVYKLYARDKFVGGGDNSMFVPPGTAAAPGNISAAPSQTYSNDAAAPLNDGRVYGEYSWVQTVNTATYNVTAAGDTTITFNMRENGYYLDKLVLSTNTALAGTDLDALVNTPATLGAPQTLTATPGGSSVKLDWAGVPAATSYNISRGTVAGGPYTSIATGVTATTFTEDNRPNGTYFYSVTASNAGGESATASPEASATVTGLLTVAPTNVQESPQTDRVVLSWDPTIGAVSYNVKRSTSLNGPFTLVTGGNVTGTTFTDTTVTAGTQYYYTVSAVNPNGESPASITTPGKTLSATHGWSAAFYFSSDGNNPRIFSSANSRFGYTTTTPTINYRGGGEGTAPPGAPANWNPNGTGKAFDTHWEGIIQIPFTDNYTLFGGSDDGIRVTVDGVVLTPDNINADRGYVEDTESPVLSLTAGQYVRVQVDYNQGGGGWDATLSAQASDGNNPLGTTKGILPQALVYIPQPKPVSNLTTAVNTATAVLRWKPGNVEADNYNIYTSSTGAPGTFTLLATAPGNAQSFTQNGLVNGQTYYYMVTEVNASGESLLSNVVSATPGNLPPDAPLTPTVRGTITLTAPAKPMPTVSWPAQLFTDTYNVYRSTTAGGTYTKIAQGITGTSYVDNDATLAFGNTYFYKVSGSNAFGEGPQSASASAAFTSGAELHAYNDQWWRSINHGTNGYKDIGAGVDYAEVRGTIDFDNPPVSTIGPNNYSQVATGKIHVNVAGDYTFVNATDDDGYLIVNGQLVASDPGGHGVQNAFLGGTGGTHVVQTLAVGDYDYIQFMSQGGGGSGIHFRMVDPNPANNGAIITVPAFGTANAPVTYGSSIVSSIPAQATNVTATQGSATDVNLSFTDNATSELQYLIQRSTSLAGPYTTIATIALHDNTTTSPVTFNDGSTKGGVTYFYRVMGQNFDGTGTPSTPVSVTAGTTVVGGLEGHYYGNPNYALPGVKTITGADITRLDPNVDFANGTGFPTDSSGTPNIAGVFANNFSIRWTGKVLADTAGQYTFTLNTDDGSRLFIDGVKVTDSYFDKGQSDVTGGPVTLTAGLHNIVMEFYQIGGGFGARLEWNPADPSTGLPVVGAPQVIPQDHLVSLSDAPANPTAMTFPVSGASSVSVRFNDNATNEIGYTIERSTDPTFATGTSTLAFLPFSTTAATGPITYNDNTVAAGIHYYYRVQALNYDGSSSFLSGDVFAGPVTAGGSITGSQTASPSLIDLTANGTLDWAHFGLNTTDGFNHKTGALLISNDYLLGSDYQHRFTGNATSFQWSDGTPTQTATTDNGIFTNGLNNGFEITAPATTTDRTLKVYVGVFNSNGTLTARLSDGSAATFVDSSLVNLAGSKVAVYTITYHAGSANQQLIVDWVNTNNNGGNVALVAATLGLPSDFIAPSLSKLQQQDSAVVVSIFPNTITQTGFEIQRSSDGVNFVTIGTAGPGAKSFIDKGTGLTQYATYTYQVRALGTPANSAFSLPLSIVYLPPTVSGQHANGFAAPTPGTITLDGLPISGGFENPSTSPNTFTYNPTGGPWTFNGTTGVIWGPQANFSPNQGAPEGVQVAFLQTNPGDSRNDPVNGQYIGQTINFPTAGTFVFADADANRPGYQGSYKVVLDPGTANEKVIFTSKPSGTAFTQHVSAPFTTTAGNHELRLVSTASGPDNTALIDAVRIVSQASYAPLPIPFQDLQLNGNAAFQPPTSFDQGAGYQGRLRLTTTNGGQTASAFERVATGSLVGGFTTTFDYQLVNPGNPPADGVAFVLQGVGPGALGGGGGAFGYDGIGNSLAIYLNEYNGVTQTGIGINGTRQAAVLDMSGALGNAFHVFNQSVDGSQATDLFKVTLTYNLATQTLTETVVDAANASATYTHDFTGIDLKSILGASGAAYAGFTGATGGAQATHDIVDWTMAPTSITPVLKSTAIGDGTAQRSEVRQFTMSFDRAVILDPGTVTAVRLNTGGSGLNDGSAPTDVSAALGTPVSNDGGYTWIVPVLKNVTGLTDATGSLADGIYTLTIHSASVTDTATHALAGPDQAQTTHRLFGDINGSKGVNNADYILFRNAFGSSNGQAAYVNAFDFDNNGVINNADYIQLRNRFGKSPFAY